MFSFGMNEAWFHVSVVALKIGLYFESSQDQVHENTVWSLNLSPTQHPSIMIIVTLLL